MPIHSRRCHRPEDSGGRTRTLPSCDDCDRRERVIRIFPNRDSVIRLVGALHMEMDEKWQTGHKYLDMEEYLAWRGEQLELQKDATKVHQIS